MSLNRVTKNLIAFILFCLAALLILRNVVTGDNPGLIYDWNNQLINFGHAIKDSLFAYSPVDNGVATGQKTFFVWNIIFQLIGYSGISVLLFYKILFILLFALGGYTVFLLLRYIGFSNRISFLSGFFYMTSPVLLIRFSAGYFGYLISGAFFPLLISFYLKASQEKKILNRALILAAFTSLLAFCQIHFIAFFIIVGLIDIVLSFALGGAWTRKIISLILVGFFYALLNLSWLGSAIISAKSILSTSSFNAMAFLSRLDTLPHNFWNTLLLSDHGNVENVMLAINSSAPRLILVFALLAAIFYFGFKNQKRRNFYILSLAIGAFALVLSVGPTAPFKSIYAFLLGRIPGLQMFRESYHLEYLILISYTLVLAINLEYLWNRVLKLNFKKISSASPNIYLFIAALFSIVYFNLPAFSGDLFGHLGSVKLPNNLSEINKKIQDVSSERIFYPPNLSFWKMKGDRRSGINYPDNIAYSLKNVPVNQASSDLDAKNPSWKLRNATVNSFMTKDKDFLYLLPYLGSDLIVDRKYLDNYYYLSAGMDTKRKELRDIWMVETNEDKLKAWPGLEKTALGQETYAYRLKDSKGLVYISTNPVSVCNYGELGGNADSFTLESKSSDLNPYLREACSNQEEKSLVLSDNKLSFGGLKNLKHNADFGWSPGYLSFYESKIFSNTIEDFVFTRIPDEFQFDLAPVKQNLKLLIKYYSSPRSGEITINDQKIETNGTGEGWRYKELTPSGSGNYTVKSISGENAIGDIGFVEQANSDQIQTQKVGISELTYENINPTRFNINIKNKTDQPKLIILSNNYDPNWVLRVGDQEFSPALINSYANGYLIPGNLAGDGKIEFKGQKQYRILLDISVVIFIALLILYSYLTIWNQGGKKH